MEKADMLTSRQAGSCIHYRQGGREVLRESTSKDKQFFFLRSNSRWLQASKQDAGGVLALFGHILNAFADTLAGRDTVVCHTSAAHAYAALMLMDRRALA
jgi:hypothetical protein